MIKRVIEYFNILRKSKEIFLKPVDPELNEIFLRQYSPSPGQWMGEDPNYKELALRYLGSKEGNCSVFQIDSILNESKILLAIYTKYGRSSCSKTYGIRIPKKEIKELGLSIKHTPSSGTTEVEEVDKLHWEIEGTEDKFERLAQRISNGIKICEDRFRVLESNQVKEGLRILANLAGVTEPVRQKCLKASK